MKKRILILIGAAATIIVLLGVYFEPTHCVRGWLWDEAFFHGRPTSYWRGVVVLDLQTDPQEIIGGVRPTLWQRACASVGVRPKVDSSFQLASDADADDVLRELTENDNERVAGFAKDVLARLRPMPAPQPAALQDEMAFEFTTWFELISKHRE